MRGMVDVAKSLLPDSVRYAIKKAAYGLRNRGFEPYRKHKNIEGVSFDFWIGDADARQWYDADGLDPEWPEMRFIRDHMLQDGDIVLECGAHQGLTTILFSNWVGPNGKVVAFEPDPVNYGILQRNIEVNKIVNVRTEWKAVGAVNGKVNISRVSNSTVVPSNRGVAVEMTNLDQYAYLHPTFLKIDVEGFEVDVLRGSQKLLEGKPKLAIEIHPQAIARYGASVADLFGAIDVGSYDSWAQWDDRTAPVRYDPEVPISARVHLFCIPKRP
jgi:FkbM family methyltransferase